MSVNHHIEMNLEHYFSLHEPEYAFLITGSWGVGKTYFIDSVIESTEQKNEKIKIVKISLFGLKRSSEINDLIFQSFHPILGSKGMRMAGNIFKSAIKLGLKVDLDSDGKPDGQVEFKSENIFSEIIERLKNNKENGFVLILDDLERTDISITEILGYINYIVEISKQKVVLIANESNISEKEKYNLFKEKVVGKTFEVKHDFDEFINATVQKHPSCDLSGNVEIIKDIYEKSKLKNLRKIKRSIENFEYLISHIDEYKSNDEFYKNLIRCYFSLSMEIATGNINEEAIRNKFPFNRVNADEKLFENSGLTSKEIYENYFKGYPQLYSGDAWCDFLYKGDIEKITSLTKDLVYFNKDKNNVKDDPLWLKLWYYNKLELDEFNKLLHEMEDDFKSLKEYELPIYLHIVSLMIFFIKNGLGSLSIQDVKNTVNQYAVKFKTSPHWKQSYIGKKGRINGSGYGYICDEDGDNDFDFCRELIRSENEKSYLAEEAEHTKNKIIEATSHLFNEFNDTTFKSSYEEYKYEPIFKHIDPTEFTHVILNKCNNEISTFNQHLFARYTESMNLNNRPICFYFRSELSFWISLEKELTKNITDSDRLKRHLIQLLINNNIKRIINILETHQS
ncbi:P-loop NTPase fold protein [Aeromonas dhakensis]|uniref:P-loop NTPase fold protein n=1 Tax=Aeromonas dhakensis TaxID=196024 RepID=UPI001C5B04DF|nr:P-loop NTPase fold protein [Aeromonas dhakensis]MBW3692487.1 hypothetical protein [Aeromonas dhakensis]